MKVLLDACVWGGARADLEAAGHDVVWAGGWAEDPGDEEILARAHADGRVVVTLDKDFGLLAVLRSLPHAGIVRLVDLAAREQGPAAVATIARHAAELAGGAIVTVEPGRVRVRPGT